MKTRRWLEPSTIQGRQEYRDLRKELREARSRLAGVRRALVSQAGRVTTGTPLAREAHVQARGASRPARRRVQVRLPLTARTEIVFGISLSTPRRRRRSLGTTRRWARATMIAGCCVLAVIVPIATVTAAPDLERIGALAVPARHPTALDASNYVAVPRAVVRARRSLVTEVRREPPALRAHVVAPGETLDDDLFASGQTVTVAGRVTGDVYATGQTVVVTGTVDGDLLSAAQQVVVDGAVNGNVRAALRYRPSRSFTDLHII